MKAVIVTYVVKKGRETEFVRVLRRHWKILKSEGLATDQLPFLFCDPENPSIFKEIFEWRSKTSFKKAHQSPNVQKIWKTLNDLTLEGGIEHAYFNKI